MSDLSLLRPVSPTRRDVDVASAQALAAHHALGRMSACSSVAEFALAANEFLASARGLAQAVAKLARSAANDHGTTKRRAFAAWFAIQVTPVVQHPVQSELLRGAPEVYVARPARGSDAPPFAGAPMVRVPKPRPRAEDFYFDGVDKRPAIELCAEYLERVTSLIDDSRRTLARIA
ncbi:MAG TPA: hypothetical protein VK427_09160 [Kofleriaceae bacterium]|nr:hypothetical protein [Kofleriaceae bacterium]